MRFYKKALSLLLCVTLLLSFSGCDKKGQGIAEGTTTEVTKALKDMTPEEIVATLTLEQKAQQMLQPACYNIKPKDMKKNCYGSVLSKGEDLDSTEWPGFIDEFQKNALESKAGIPFIYGQDHLHGVAYCTDAVFFPQNIGMGAANDPELMKEIGRVTASEGMNTHMQLNFSPCLAQAVDPRWGRTFESYGTDLDIITSLGTAYTEGLLEGGMVVCPKHYFGDGNVKFGTGENSDVERLIDRGDAQLNDEEIEALLAVYQAQIDAGAQVIMISHSSLNGIKMHENGEYIWKLKNEMGFEGFVLSDWNSVQNTSGKTYYDQMVTAVNSGIDMFMEPDTFDDAIDIICNAVKKGDIKEERIDDAVTRIIKVKKEAGLFDDPFYENIKKEQVGSSEHRALAEKAVEESLVLLKNEGDVLPLKPGTSIFITGPAADDASAQCGGWTVQWRGIGEKHFDGVTTLQQGFIDKAEEYGITVYTDIADADKADVIVLCVGEQASVEWEGDTAVPDLCGPLGLTENADAMAFGKDFGKPIVTLIVAGRQVFVSDYIDDWDAAVMCYLPCSEGEGVANVLCGATDFRGKLPSPWYSSTEQIGTDECWLEKGFGLTYE